MAETQVLKNWINPQYLAEETIQQIQQGFQSNLLIPSIQMGNFLLPQKANDLLKVMERMKWTQEYIPHMYSFQRSQNEKPLELFYSFLNSSGFKVFIGTLLKKEIKQIEPESLLFQHRDYTILHDVVSAKQEIFLCFDFTVDWEPSSGGQMVFTHPKIDPQIFAPGFNILNIVKLDSEINYFVKYVNSAAGKRKRFVVRCTDGL